MTATQTIAVLDTDIGSDVDDILALVLLMHAPDIHLAGVTTVYGDTRLRAQIARFVCDRMLQPDVAVCAGEAETITGREVWWAGHEGQGIPDLDQVAIDGSLDGVSYLCRQAREHPGQLDIFAIGPLTNIARAVQADPGFVSGVRHLYIMGGAWWTEKPEHNIKCDPEAADIVFRSGMPITACGLDVTTKVWLRGPDVDEIARSMDSLGPILADQIRAWWAFKSADPHADAEESQANNPHDPLAVLAALHPELFQFEMCDVRVGLDENNLGRTLISNCGNGAIRIASSVQVSRAERAIVRGIVGPGQG